jgi:hypothetical protein
MALRTCTTIAGISLLVGALLAPMEAAAQRWRYGGRRAPWIERPLTTERKHLDLYGGVGWAHNFHNRDSGVGMHNELMAGLLDFLEVGAGFGARFNHNAQTLSADRFGRINREWLPDPYASGFDPVTNPYFRMRLAFGPRLANPPFEIGVEVFHNLPFAYRTCFVAGVGLPIHIATPRVRVETGFFHQSTARCHPRDAFVPYDHLMYIPVRVNFAITRAFWLGVRSGIEAYEYRFDGEHWYVPLGMQGGVRLFEQLDLVFDVVFPEFLHWSTARQRHVFFDTIGLGLGVIARIF